MRRVFGWALAGGLAFGLASAAEAQVNVTVNPPAGSTVSVAPAPATAAPIGGYSPLVGWSSLYPSLYGVAAPNPWPSNYYAPAPGTTSYNSGYAGFAPTTRAYGTTTYDVYAPYQMGSGTPIYGYNYYNVGPSYGAAGYRGGLVGGMINRSTRW